VDFAGLFSGYGWISLICLIVGLGFVIVEMFHPGFGAPGIIGGILLIAGVLLYARSLMQALIMIIVILAILGVVLTLVLQSASRGHLARHLVLYDSLDKDDRFSASEDLAYFIGSEGTTITVLRPSGTANFNGVKLDVVSEGEFIPKDSNVKIVKVEGHRIVVNQII
jgi:membrane-bound ClpP family serine protease